MKNINIILIILLVISVSLVSLVMAIEENSYNLDYYMDSFTENEVYDVTGKSRNELNRISKNIITYLKGNDDQALNNDFNQREIHHMDDVLKLFEMARLIKIISAIIALTIISWFLSKKRGRFMGKWMSLGIFANHILLVVLIVLVLTDFTKYFTIFHKMFFNNDLWILNPRTDLLIQMLPEPFFINISKNIALSFIKYLTLTQIIGYIFYKKGKYTIGRFNSSMRY